MYKLSARLIVVAKFLFLHFQLIQQIVYCFRVVLLNLRIIREPVYFRELDAVLCNGKVKSEVFKLRYGLCNL